MPLLPGVVLTGVNRRLEKSHIQPDIWKNTHVQRYQYIIHNLPTSAVDDGSSHTPGCSWGPPAGPGRREEEGREEHGANLGCRRLCRCRTPALCPGDRGGSSCCLPWAPRFGCCLAGACGAERGRESELSGVVSSVTSLNKAQLVGRQRIRQDFCRPAGECFLPRFYNQH